VQFSAALPATAAFLSGLIAQFMALVMALCAARN
jgi:hypothetical protein